MKCSDCKWFDNTVQQRGVPDPKDTGLCRVAAPSVQIGPRGWPFCRVTDWCGRFTQRAD